MFAADGKFENGVLTVKVDGRVDSVTADDLDKKLTELRKEYPDGEIRLDFADLNYISSAGLRALLRLRKGEPEPVAIDNMSEAVREIFEVTGFSDLFEITD